MPIVASFRCPWASWSTQAPPFPSIIQRFHDLNVLALPSPFSHAFTISPSSSFQTTLFASFALPLTASRGSDSLSLSPSQRANCSGGRTAPSAALSPPWHSWHLALLFLREHAYCTEFSIFVPPFELCVRELFVPLRSFSFGSWVASRSSAPCFFYADRLYRLLSSLFIRSS